MMKIELNSDDFGQKHIFDFEELLENMQLRDLLTIQRLISLELNRRLLRVEWVVNNKG